LAKNFNILIFQSKSYLGSNLAKAVIFLEFFSHNARIIQKVSIYYLKLMYYFIMKLK